VRREGEDEVVDYSLLYPQAVVGFVDAISLMIVLPSLVFYVRQAGGTQAQYGIICSSFAFASFTFKPILGYWSDRTGNRFRTPYLTSIAIATTGAFLYFSASLFSPSNTAVTMILVGRLLGGCGAANNSLGYTYITQVIEQRHMTRAGAMLSMVRVFGMTIAPGFNALLSKIRFEIPNPFTFREDGGTLFEIDHLNVVGLVLVLGNLLGFVTIMYGLKEPQRQNGYEIITEQPQQQSSCNDEVVSDARDTSVKCGSANGGTVSIPITVPSGDAEGGTANEQGLQFWKHCIRSELLVPILAYFTLNFNFQFMETGLAPAAFMALGWETVAISIVFGIDSLLLFFVYIGTFQLSARGLTDVSLMKLGLVCSIIGYSLMFLWWRRGVMMWMFATPSTFSRFVCCQ